MLPCLDSEEMAASRTRELRIHREHAAALGRSAVEAADNGFYDTEGGKTVVWRDAVQAALNTRVSIRPGASLPIHTADAFNETTVQVTNETSLAASRRLVE